MDSFGDVLGMAGYGEVYNYVLKSRCFWRLVMNHHLESKLVSRGIKQ